MTENGENYQKNAKKNSELSSDFSGKCGSGDGGGENDKAGGGGIGSGKKENLLDFTKQLVSLGALQQAIVRNLQKEIENLKSQ